MLCFGLLFKKRVLDAFSCQELFSGSISWSEIRGETKNWLREKFRTLRINFKGLFKHIWSPHQNFLNDFKKLSFPWVFSSTMIYSLLIRRGPDSGSLVSHRSNKGKKSLEDIKISKLSMDIKFLALLLKFPSHWGKMAAINMDLVQGVGVKSIDFTPPEILNIFG